MKRIMVLLGLSVMAFAFTTLSDTDDLVKALKAGNAEQVATYFDNFIDLKLPEKDEVKNMGKNQAGIALKAFFTENSIKTFDLTSEREMGGTMYIAGKLQNNGKGFNITVMLKKQGDKYQVVTIRII